MNMDHSMQLGDSASKGVSRSGRVRKKSSKLNDFLDSTEDITAPKKKQPNPKKGKQAKQIEQFPSDESSLTEGDESDGLEGMNEIDIKEEPIDDYPIEWDNAEAHLLDAIKDEFDDEDDMEGFEEESHDASHLDDDDTKDSSGFSQAHSLYLSEKKKPTAKDGSLKIQKAERKDKGKSRFTAYMLWAKSVRSEIVALNPSMDFSGVNKRLGEMWALVPTSQKYKWQNKAKRIAAKGEKAARGSMISTGKSKKYIVSQKNALSKRPLQPTTPRMKQEARLPQQQVTPKINYQTPMRSVKVPQESLEMSASSTFKASGDSPIDCAAHLNLLGESLNNIGQKLKEHEGEIAVSGSLSVLLDSMLCVLGPLACLTNEVAELESAIPEETRASVLDNIAYIMPGIV